MVMHRPWNNKKSSCLDFSYCCDDGEAKVEEKQTNQMNLNKWNRPTVVKGEWGSKRMNPNEWNRPKVVKGDM
jgi:hypothetical protein